LHVNSKISVDDKRMSSTMIGYVTLSSLDKMYPREIKYTAKMHEFSNIC
jgi:hypothetical protein